MELKFKIKELAEKRGIPYSKLARLTDCHLQSISNYANIKIDDERSIPSDKLRVLAKAFNTTMEEMYTS
jgi:transcriptional regulator with XRE-family HTH domain